MRERQIRVFDRRVWALLLVSRVRFWYGRKMESFGSLVGCREDLGSECLESVGSSV